MLAIAVAVYAWSAISYHDRSEEADAAHFLTAVREPLMTRLGTVAQAEAAGYVQVTNLGPHGTSTYFDRTFTAVDPLHPNFLWFDKHRNLVGIDYEVPTTTYPQPPGYNLFAVKQQRWTIVPAHVHVAYRDAGITVLKEGDALPNLLGDNVSPETLTDDGLLPLGDRLLWFSFHPRSWDLSLWLLHNPFGASAPYDPYVYL